MNKSTVRDHSHTPSVKESYITSSSLNFTPNEITEVAGCLYAYNLNNCYFNDYNDGSYFPPMSYYDQPGQQAWHLNDSASRNLFVLPIGGTVWTLSEWDGRVF